MDTTRADHCTTNGYARPTTPRLAEFAKDAVTFTEAWSPSSWTGPAHASLFTGLQVSNHGILTSPTAHLDERFETLAERLAARGWSTACFSGNPFVAPAFGLTQGFATFESFAPKSGEPPRETPARASTRRALEWMKSQRADGKPFFAFINAMEPHAPYNPPSIVAQRFLRPGTPAAAESEARAMKHPRTLVLGLGLEPLTEDVRAAVTELYDAEIATVDAELGTLLDGMRAAGLLDHTVVVVTADHGEGLGDHGWIEHSVFLHRELLHVPLVVRVPGSLQGGRTESAVVRLEDVAPTVLEACGAGVPSGGDALDGASLLHDLAGRTARAAEKAPLEWYERAVGLVGDRAAAPVRLARVSAFDGQFHLIVDSDGAARLFDVANDPAELHDVSGTMAAKVSSLTALLPPFPQ
ncbi:MAG: sulfatase [Planctomycetes bacterium]|nr:sulfatase [Planctomycetota bacterium]